MDSFSVVCFLLHVSRIFEGPGHQDHPFVCFCTFVFFFVFAVSFAFSVAFSFSVLLCSNWFCFFKIVGCFSLLLLLAFPQKVVRFSCALVFAFFIFSSLEVGLRHFTKLAKARYSAYYQNPSKSIKHYESHAICKSLWSLHTPPAALKACLTGMTRLLQSIAESHSQIPYDLFAQGPQGTIACCSMLQHAVVL